MQKLKKLHHPPLKPGWAGTEDSKVKTIFMIKTLRKFNLSWKRIIEIFRVKYFQRKSNITIEGNLITGIVLPTNQTLEVWQNTVNFYTITLSSPKQLFEKIINCSSREKVMSQVSRLCKNVSKTELERIMKDLLRV